MHTPAHEHDRRRFLYISIAIVWGVLLSTHSMRLMQGVPDGYPGQHVKGISLTASCLVGTVANLFRPQVKAVLTTISIIGLIVTFVLMLGYRG